MLYSCQLGQRSGIVTMNTRYIPWFHHQITKYGLERRVTGVHAMQFEPGQILKHMNWKIWPMKWRAYLPTGEAARGLGVDVLIPGGGIPMLLFSAIRGSRRWGPGYQRHSDRRQDGGDGRQTAAARGPWRKPRLRLRSAAARKFWKNS